MDDEGRGYPIEVDALSRALLMIQFEHHEIHEGDAYRAGFTKDVANAGTAAIGLVTPDTTEYLHMRPAVDMELEANVKIYEGATLSGGSAITPRNSNRNSDNASAATLTSDPTFDVGSATLLANLTLGSGRSSGGNQSADFEWVLKRNTKYLFLVTNNTANSNQINIRLFWYEHGEE